MNSNIIIQTLNKIEHVAKESSKNGKYERDEKSRPIWSILIFRGVACVSRRDELGMMLLPQLSHVTCPSSRLANRSLQRHLPFGKSALFWKRFTLDRVGHLLIPRWALQVLKLGSGDSWRKSCDLDFFDRENISHRPAVKEVTSPDNVCWFYFNFFNFNYFLCIVSTPWGFNFNIVLPALSHFKRG